MSKKDERQKIKATVKSTVASVLAEDETTQKAKMEEVFAEYETTLAELRDAEVAASEKNAELLSQIESLTAEKEALESEIESLKEELATAKTQLEEANKKTADLEIKLNDMEKEAAMQRRVKELEEAGLLSSGKSADRLKVRIKGMNDEEYAEFKSDLELWKSDLMKDIPAPVSTPDTGVAEPVAPVAPSTVATTDDGKTNPDTVVNVEPVTASTTDADTSTPDVDANASPDGAVTDVDSAKMTARIMQLRKELASLNLKTSIPSLDDDEALVKEYASVLWQVQEESK